MGNNMYQTSYIIQVSIPLIPSPVVHHFTPAKQVQTDLVDAICDGQHIRG